MDKTFGNLKKGDKIWIVNDRNDDKLPEIKEAEIWHDSSHTSTLYPTSTLFNKDEDCVIFYRYLGKKGKYRSIVDSNCDAYSLRSDTSITINKEDAIDIKKCWLKNKLSEYMDKLKTLNSKIDKLMEALENEENV